jgi:hypothetical protein
MATCQEELAELRVALQQLRLGKQIVSVGYGERRVQYTPAQEHLLVRAIALKEAECGTSEQKILARRRPSRPIY